MCFSAKIEGDVFKVAKRWRAVVDLPFFEGVFARRLEDSSIKIPKALEANFYKPSTPTEERIKRSIDKYHERQSKNYETALFTQQKRLADAERVLGKKETKKALEDKRIATNKIAWHLAKIADLKRTKPKESDSRIFPFWYAPVVIVENGRRVIRPMRYHCRPNGKPESYDQRYDGLYNARRDNLEGFWKNVFGKHHGFFVASSFYENVALNDFEKRPLMACEKPKNLVLHFNPKSTGDMLVACLWDHWQSPGKPDLYSFAAITDEPPPEVAATGHDRCIIPLKESALEAWLNPDCYDKAKCNRVLDERERPYYEHRMAA